MAQTIHCDEHGLCIAQCELCVDEKHEREIAELERMLERYQKVAEAAKEYFIDPDEELMKLNPKWFKKYDAVRRALRELEGE